MRNDTHPASLETSRGPVTLHAFVAFASDDAVVRLNPEHSACCWCSVEEALQRVPLRSQRAALERAMEWIVGGGAEKVLEATRAEEVSHPGGHLRAHLERTAALLGKFDARAALQRAGLLHAVYGTAGFERSLLRLQDRGLLRALVGDEVEEIVYLYAACDREHLYSALNRGQTHYRNRFDGRLRTLTLRETRDLVELMFANELDIAQQDGRFWAEHGASLGELFRSCRQWASDRAFAEFSDLEDRHNRNAVTRAKGKTG